ncbi:MAG: hypothetical protein R2794_01045 [Chitinophagales bacterium]
MQGPSRNFVPAFTGWAILHTYTTGDDVGKQVRVEMDTAFQVLKVTSVQ